MIVTIETRDVDGGKQVHLVIGETAFPVGPKFPPADTDEAAVQQVADLIGGMFLPPIELPGPVEDPLPLTPRE